MLETCRITMSRQTTPLKAGPNFAIAASVTKRLAGTSPHSLPPKALREQNSARKWDSTPTSIEYDRYPVESLHSVDNVQKSVYGLMCALAKSLLRQRQTIRLTLSSHRTSACDRNEYSRDCTKPCSTSMAFYRGKR